MATTTEIRFKKKPYDASTDNEEGLIVFDTTLKKVYVGGVMYGCDIVSVTLTDNKLVFTKTDGTTIEFAGGGTEQVQADWDVEDTTSKAYIKNKPSIPEEQVQSNWNETNTTSKAYIQNKPSVLTDVPENAVFTDTKVTSASNHYTPETNTQSDKTVVNGSHIKTITMDNKGHITGVNGETIATEVANTTTPLVVPASTSYSGQLRNITLSTAEPSGGVSGDIWIQYEN